MFRQKRNIQKEKSERGQAAVEFAVILPVFICILCAVIDFGWIFMHEINVTNAAREGARAGIVCASDADFNSKVNNRVREAAPNLKTSGLSVSAVKKGSSGNENVEVTLDYALETLTPVGRLIFGSAYHVKGQCTMKI